MVGHGVDGEGSPCVNHTAEVVQSPLVKGAHAMGVILVVVNDQGTVVSLTADGQLSPCFSGVGQRVIWPVANGALCQWWIPICEFGQLPKGRVSHAV